MTVTCRDDILYVEVQTPRQNDSRAQFLVDRELDRLFFLTHLRVKAEVCGGSVSADLRMTWNIHGAIPSGTKPQRWNHSLGIQLRLWSLASETDDPILKIILLYQIIELSFPNLSSYPQYKDSRYPPDPLTECRFLRHLVVHVGAVDSASLRAYCAHMGFPSTMLDRTDAAHVERVSGKWRLLEQQASNILRRALGLPVAGAGSASKSP